MLRWGRIVSSKFGMVFPVRAMDRPALDLRVLLQYVMRS